MIWHVIKKDLRALWWLAPLLAVAAIDYGYSAYFSLSSPSLQGFVPILKAAVIYALPYVIVFFAMARAVQIDSPIALRADWHTRPINPLDILGSKALIAVVGVVLPWWMIDLGWGFYWGMSPAQVLIGAAWHALATGGLVLWVIAVAAGFRTLIPFLLSFFAQVIAIVVVVLGVEGVFRFLDHSWRGAIEITPDWFDNGLTVLMFAGLMASLYLVFWHRSAAKARALVFASTVGLVLIIGLVGEWRGRSLDMGLATANPGVAMNVAGPPVWLQLSSGIANLNLDLDKAMSSPKLDAQVQRMVISRHWADGSVVHTAFKNSQPRTVSLATASKARIDQRPVKLDIRYRLKLRERQPPVTLKSKGATQLGSGVSCLVSNQETASTLHCRSSGEFCVEVLGEPPGPAMLCTGVVSPFAPFHEVSKEISPGAALQISWLKPAGVLSGSTQTDWMVPQVKVAPPGMPLRIILGR